MASGTSSSSASTDPPHQRRTPGAEPAPEGMPQATHVVKQRFVTTGPTRGDLVGITDGLKPGEVVVTSGLLRLRNDAGVTINNKVQPAAQAKPEPENR